MYEICLHKYNMINQLVMKHKMLFIPLKTIYCRHVIVFIYLV